jgi:hypothetical protein
VLVKETTYLKVKKLLNDIEVGDVIASELNEYYIIKNISNYKKWVGAYGAVSVKYEFREHEFEANRIVCLSGKSKNKLPPWKDAAADTSVKLFQDLPF